MYPRAHPSRHRSRLYDIEALHRETRRALWLGRVLQLVTLVLLLGTLAFIVRQSWPVQTAAALADAREWVSSLISPR